MSEEDIQALKTALQKQRSGGDQEVGLVQVGVALHALIPMAFTVRATYLGTPAYFSKLQQFVKVLLHLQGILEEVRLISWPNPLQVWWYI